MLKTLLLNAKSPAPHRYDGMVYRRCGTSGLMLPAISLGCWFNFGDDDSTAAQRRRVITRAFDHGITHFDLANTYGPPMGSAERNVGKVLRELPRDELIVATKAGWTMWPGPYGDWGSRKHILASCDASLRRLKLDYVDIFYHHRPDPNTPLEESLSALEQLVRQGKALYAGISAYSGTRTALAGGLLTSLSGGRVALTIHQPRYNLLDRGIEADLLPVTAKLGAGVICFSPLAMGVLTGKYLQAAAPKDSRITRGLSWFNASSITPELRVKLAALQVIAEAREQSLAQLAISWVLRDERVTSALIGARTVEQLEHNVAAINNLAFDATTLTEIDRILAGT